MGVREVQPTVRCIAYNKNPDNNNSLLGFLLLARKDTVHPWMESVCVWGGGGVCCHARLWGGRSDAGYRVFVFVTSPACVY